MKHILTLIDKLITKDILKEIDRDYLKLIYLRFE